MAPRPKAKPERPGAVRPSAQSARQKRSRRKAWLSQGLNWWVVGTVVLVAFLLLLWLKYSSAEDHLAKLRRQGAVLYRGQPRLIALLWRFLYSILTGSYGAEDGIAGGAVAAFAATAGSALAFVPNTMTFTVRSASTPGVREELERLASEAKRDGGRSLLGRSPGLATALAALAERRASQQPPPGGQHAARARAHRLWLRSLPERFGFSRRLSSEQRAVLEGTLASSAAQEHERLVSELQELDLASLQGRLTEAEAEWAVGLMLHHGLDNGAALAPGLLDGVARHWDPARCVELVKNVAATGRLPGWALAANREVAVGEPLRLCPGRPTNGHLLALYGVAYADNPNGPMMMQGGHSHRVLELAVAAADSVRCAQGTVIHLALDARRDRPPLGEESVRCSSLVWMRSPAAAAEAMEAGYFHQWPRFAAEADERWLAAERAFYWQVRDNCNSSSREIGRNADEATLERLHRDGTELSRLTLLVRSGELEAYQRCAEWADARARALLPHGVDESEEQPPSHEEL